MAVAPTLIRRKRANDVVFWVVLMLLLPACSPQRVSVKPAPTPIAVYNPCNPPFGDEFPDGPNDPYWKGYAWTHMPTACI